MFYYDDSGCLGCLIGLIILLVIGAVLLSPYFWILVAVLLIWSAIRNAMSRRKNTGDADDVRSESSGSASEPSHDADDAFDAAKMATSDEDIQEEYETDVIDVSDVDVQTVEDKDKRE